MNCSVGKVCVAIEVAAVLTSVVKDRSQLVALFERWLILRLTQDGKASREAFAYTIGLFDHRRNK